MVVSIVGVSFWRTSSRPIFVSYFPYFYIIVETNEWLQVPAKGVGPGAIAFHQSVAVYKKDRK
jgi:hypothetical protein